MALKATVKKMGGATVVYLNGVIFFGEESSYLRTLVKDLLNESREIVFDLGSVTRIDSGGLGTLVGLYASARKLGGDIKLASLVGHANEVLQITKLVRVFEIFDRAEDAAASFRRATAAN
jgi:anti-sigma B factor antagonist